MQDSNPSANSSSGQASGADRRARSSSADYQGLVAGSTMGAYRIEHKLGSGGMSDVYFGLHKELNRPAAIKVLRASLAEDDVHLQRFMQEARAAAALVHPNIVQVYDVGRDGDYRYIAQEFIAGSNLRQYLANDNAKSRAHGDPAIALEPTDAPVSLESSGEVVEGNLDDGATPALSFEQDTPASNTPANNATGNNATGNNATGNNAAKTNDCQLPIDETLSILLQVLAALSKSAASGIVHRDIKPENIMLTVDGDVKVTDFGLARVLLGDDPQLTRAGTTLGTPMYMSPEQIQEGQVDLRSDLYSLGVTLFHMLCGRPPFTGETPLALAMQHVQAPVPDVLQWRSDVPTSLVDLVSRLLQKSPEDRFPGPREVLEFLRGHRSQDLAEFWPEHTVPLPRAASVQVGVPLQATLTLQAKLRAHAKRRGLQWLTLAAAMLLPLAAVLAGVAIARRPVDLFGTDVTQGPQQPDIQQESTAEQQYVAALLNPEAGEAKWLAVERYFPPSESGLNHYWGSLARLKLAQRRSIEDVPQALRALDAILADAKTDDLVRLLANLQLAELQYGQDRSAEAAKHLQAARALAEKNGPASSNNRMAAGYIKTMPSELQSQWNAL